ncbi:MAG: hypothetical protein PVG32_15775 [Anaerolineales bacterium]|jgi:hypothetical protein
MNQIDPTDNQNEETGEGLPPDFRAKLKEPISTKSLVSQVVPEDIQEKLSMIEIARERAKKLLVARRITLMLLWLFVLQMGAFTLAYILTVYIDKSTQDVITRSTEALLDGIKTIMPVTTSFLGVAIGFYFRESKEAEEEQAENSE